MRIDSAFPSQYLKAADLQGKKITVTMSHVDMEDIGGDLKPILYFIGKDKGLVLNKTNSNTIAMMHGYETEDWSGKSITLVEAMVDFQGRTVAAIRVYAQRVAPPAAAPRPKPSAPKAPAASDDVVIDDDIPF
jgi:arabinogalactan endo-1,4-beta-galactosidase